MTQVVGAGIDHGKCVFPVRGAVSKGAVALPRRRMPTSSRSFLPLVIGVKSCAGAHRRDRAIRMKACADAHHRVGELRRIGRDVRPVPPSHVTPRKNGKTPMQAPGRPAKARNRKRSVSSVRGWVDGTGRSGLRCRRANRQRSGLTGR
ncbi:hypothetical protein [Poseidonocella sp. HB161398]|uniref:hypothetical protein n=1 Tax=Poseidonocella sp. HB161398 TaxID=2320855 RepID=UPI001107E2DB|nr:hypothetical protein [Poseidonocella sp. HB161398]